MATKTKGLASMVGDLTDLVRKQQATIERLAGKEQSIPPITIAELFKRYAITRQSDHSWRNNKNRLAPLLRRLGDLDASALTPLVWAEHRAVRETEPSARGLRKPPCAHTLNCELGRAKQLLRWATRSGLIASNPLTEAKPKRTISARETFLEEPDLRALLAACGNLTDGRSPLYDPVALRGAILRAFILACCDSMLRFNEARHLRRDRIGSDGTVELSAHRTKSRRRRVVALTARTLEQIEAIPAHPTDPHVFLNPTTGKLITENTIRAWFRRACEASGVDAKVAEGDRRLRIHDLRHTGASAADALGASPSAIKDALGHSSLQVTERYLHRHRKSSALDIARIIQIQAEKVAS